METGLTRLQVSFCSEDVKKPNLREEMETLLSASYKGVFHQVKKPNLREEMETLAAVLPAPSF